MYTYFIFCHNEQEKGLDWFYFWMTSNQWICFCSFIYLSENIYLVVKCQECLLSVCIGWYKDLKQTLITI